MRRCRAVRVDCRLGRVDADGDGCLCRRVARGIRRPGAHDMLAVDRSRTPRRSARSRSPASSPSPTASSMRVRRSRSSVAVARTVTGESHQSRRPSTPSSAELDCGCRGVERLAEDLELAEADAAFVRPSDCAVSTSADSRCRRPGSNVTGFGASRSVAVPVGVRHVDPRTVDECLRRPRLGHGDAVACVGAGLVAPEMRATPSTRTGSAPRVADPAGGRPVCGDDVDHTVSCAPPV